MKKYYLHNGSENIGPFDIEDLKSKNITRTTSVWCEGMVDWKNANEVEELQLLFASIPPPIKMAVPPPPRSENVQKAATVTSNVEEEESLIFGLRKNIFYSLAAASIIIIGLVWFNNVQDTNREILSEKNRQTEAYNSQQKDLAEQNARLAEQEKIEAQRLAMEKKQALEKRINEIAEALSINYQNLEVAKQNLNDVTAFKILRTSSERNEQINNAQETIDIIKNDMQQLESEMQKINPNWVNR